MKKVLIGIAAVIVLFFILFLAMEPSSTRHRISAYLKMWQMERMWVQ